MTDDPSSEANLDAERDTLREADALVPGLIHEMRHPLMGIKAGLQLISRALGPQLVDLDEWVMVTTQLERLEELFRAYQDFLSPERARSAPFPLQPVAHQAIELLRFRLRRFGKRFTFEQVTPGASAFGTPQSVLHAITNVLVNALDALEDLPPGPRLALRVLQSPGSPDRVQIRISDEGPGVPLPLRERIFEERFTTKPQGKGSGLGLAIARRMLRPSGGTVCLVATEDPARLPWAGTEFCIDLPSGNGPGGEGK